MTAPYSRCELGRRCVKKTTDNKVFKKYTLVSAISSKGVVGWNLYENGWYDFRKDDTIYKNLSKINLRII